MDFLVEKQKLSDEVAFRYFQKGMEQGIFRDDINFRIINEAMLMSMDLLIYSDIIEDYSLSEIYSEVTFLHIRGIATEKGMKMVDAFLEEIKKESSLFPDSMFECFVNRLNLVVSETIKAFLPNENTRKNSPPPYPVKRNR